jgi:hypothetical protein
MWTSRNSKTPRPVTRCSSQDHWPDWPLYMTLLLN